MSTTLAPSLLPAAIGRVSTGVDRETAPFRYPEELKPAFLKTRDIVFRDGRRVTPSEVWEFMTVEAPRRFPNSFATSTHLGGHPTDPGFLAAIKSRYLSLTLKDRLAEERKKGAPIVLVQGGQSYEPYFAAGAIPLRPGLVMGWARGQREGLNRRQSDVRSSEILEAGRRTISIEACNQIAAHAALDEGIVEVDLIAPYLCLRCSDMAYLVETHRNKSRDIPRLLVDHPISRNNQESAVEYLAEGLHKLVDRITAITGRKVADDDLRAEIKLQNYARKLSRELVHLWWAAKIPPLNGTGLGIAYTSRDFNGDTTSTIGVLEEALEETKERIRNGVRGGGLAENPKRIFVSGSCVGPNSFQLERSGAVTVARDDNWSSLCVEVDETGNPYRALAKGIISFPYELPTVERAKWTADQIRQSRADGAIFMYNWGCNYQTGVARLLADTVKKETGIATLTLEVGELGRGQGSEQTTNRIESFLEIL